MPSRRTTSKKYPESNRGSYGCPRIGFWRLKDNDLNDDDNTDDNNDDNNYNHCGHNSDDNNTGDYIEDDLLPNVDFLVNSTNDCANPAANFLQHAMSVQASSYGTSGSSGSQSGSSSSAEVPSGSSGSSGLSSAIGVRRETLSTTGFRSTPAGSRPYLPKRSATTPKATSTPAPRAPLQHSELDLLKSNYVICQLLFASVHRVLNTVKQLRRRGK